MDPETGRRLKAADLDRGTATAGPGAMPAATAGDRPREAPLPTPGGISGCARDFQYLLPPLASLGLAGPRPDCPAPGPS